MFSPDTFLDQQFTEANDTQVIPVPIGEYTAVVDEVKARQWQSRKDPSQSGLALDIIWLVDDQGVKEFLGRDKVTVKQGVMLDLTENGTLDMSKGRNIGLGRLREALDLNRPGEAFSFNMLQGRVGKISVTHRISDDNIFAEVKNVARMA